MIRVGLTGGIAAGKSTVSARLAKDGAKVIDYDRLAHQVLDPGGPAVAPVLERFGREYADARGGVNRTALASLVFGGGGADQARHDLDAIVHPLVYALADQAERPWRNRPLVVVHDVPLLAEVHDTIPFTFDHVIAVETPDDLRIARMVNQRHMTRSQAVDRMDSQTSQTARHRLADLVVDGSESIEHMFESVDRIYERLRSEADRLR